MKPYQIVLIVIGALLVLYLILAFIGYRAAFFNDAKKKDVRFEILEGKEYESIKEKQIALLKQANSVPVSEEIYIKSYDGKRLYAKYYHINDDAPVIIQFHGYKGVGIRDMAGGFQIALQNGCNTIIPDHRGHGKSDGWTISFGIKERKDVLAWVNYVIDRFGKDVKIGLTGISMGAATVLMSLDQKLPENVKFVLADCPYSSPKEIIKKVSNEMHIPWFIATILLHSGSFIFGHFNLNESSALQSVKDSKMPIMIIHGTGDTFVPCSMSEDLKKVNPNIQLELVKDAPHGSSFFYEYDRWVTLYKEYCDKYLKN